MGAFSACSFRCRLFQALLGFTLALALVNAVPLDILDTVPSVLVAVQLPELIYGLGSANSRDLTFRLDVHESEKACGYANVTVGGKEVPYAGQGALTSRDGREFIGSWDFVCVSWDERQKEQLMRFNVTSIDGKEVKDVTFGLQFSQTRPVRVSGVRGAARMSALPITSYPDGDAAADKELMLENEVTELEMLKLQLADLEGRIVAKEHALAEAFGWDETNGSDDRCKTLKCTLHTLIDKAKSVFHDIAAGLRTLHDKDANNREPNSVLTQSQDQREHPMKFGAADGNDALLTGRPKSTSGNGRPSIPVTGIPLASTPFPLRPQPPVPESFFGHHIHIFAGVAFILILLLVLLHIRRRRARRATRPQSTSQRIRQHLRQRFAEKRARRQGPWARVCYRLREVYGRLQARHAAHKIAREERWATRKEAARVRREAFRQAFWGIFGYQPCKLDEKSAAASTIIESPRNSGDVLIDVEALAANAAEDPRPIVAPNSVADEISALRAAADMVADMIADEIRVRRSRPLQPPSSPPQRPQRPEGSVPGSPRRGSRRRSLSPGAVSNWSCETLPAYEEEEELLSNSEVSSSEESLVSDGMRGYRPVGQGADDVLGDIDIKDRKEGKGGQ